MASKYDLDKPYHYGKHKTNPYYNPNDFINISPAEIERQAKEAMEIMKSNGDKWRTENIEANRRPE